MNIITVVFKSIDEIMGELYPDVKYEIVFGSSFEREDKSQPTAAMMMATKPGGYTIIEVDPMMTMAHIIKSVIRLLSQNVSHMIIGSFNMTEQIEKDLYERYSNCVTTAYDSMSFNQGKGVDEVVLN